MGRSGAARRRASARLDSGRGRSLTLCLLFDVGFGRGENWHTAFGMMGIETF